MASPDGHTRTFDARPAAPCSPMASRWSCCVGCRDALADGDTIYAVLLGAAVNNDGSERASFTAPSPEGQAAVIAAAHDAAGIDARTLSLRRGPRHGDAAGRSDRDRGPDPRVPSPHRRSRLLRDRLAQEQRRPHGDRGRRREPDQDRARAARAAPCRRRSASRRPTRRSTSRATPFRVQTELTPWPQHATGRAAPAVSSFGFGGTNAHVVLEEAPAAAPRPRRPRGAPSCC